MENSKLIILKNQEFLGKHFIIFGDYEINNIIYRIEFPNSKNYIGQTTKTVLERIKQHIKTVKYNLKNYPIYNAIRKYDNFNIYVECVCSNIKELNNMETYFINRYDSINNGYNCDTGGNNKILSDETKNKIRLSKIGWKMTDEQKLKLSLSTKGRIPWNKNKKGLQTWSENQYIIMSKRFSGANNPNFGKLHSEETKIKMSNNRKGKPAWNKDKKIDNSHNNKKVMCIDTGEIFESITFASKALNIDASSIIKVCKNKQKKAKGKSFIYC